MFVDASVSTKDATPNGTGPTVFENALATMHAARISKTRKDQQNVFHGTSIPFFAGLGQPRPNLGEIPHFAQIFLMRQTPVLQGFLRLQGGNCSVNLG